MRAAIAADEAGADVAVISKLHPVRSHTGAAEGGINAALDDEDDWQDHAYETMKGADYVGDAPAIEAFAQEIRREVLQLERWGMAFSREEDGTVAQRPFGGMSYPRTTFAGAETGHHLLHTLYQQVAKRGIEIYDEWFVTNLAVTDHEDPSDRTCHGVVAYDLHTGDVAGFKANRGVVIATGGNGQAFDHTTNATANTGDGMAMAYRAGVPLEDMEYVQFHPTTLPSTGILITEGCRGEGGELYNNKGERFMYEYGYAANDGELASRDVVSRAELTEVQEGRGFEDGTVHLDLTHFGEEKIEERLAQINELARDFEDVDPVTEPIPVKPGQHYMMGGIACDPNGATELDGLYAVGETACVSVHGANRLGGNALLELVVFGKISGEHAAKNHLTNVSTSAVENAVDNERARIEALMDGSGDHQSEIRQDVQDVMTEEVNVFRAEDGLERALEVIDEAKQRYRDVNIEDTSKTFNTDLTQALELRSIIDCAEAITVGALERTESRGAHWRYEHQNRNDENWLKHTYVYHTDEGPQVEYEDVEIKDYKPKARSY